MNAKSKIPAIRFEGFSEEWGQKKLYEVCQKFQSGKFIKAEAIRVEGSYPVYGGNGLRGYTDSFNYDGTYALIGRQGALCGNMSISRGKAYFTEHAIVVESNDYSNTTFLFYLLGIMELGQYSGQSAQPGLAVNKLIELRAWFSSPSEQTKIGNYFQQLDTLIAQHQKKHDKLLNLKKALLEKLFPKQGTTEPEIRFKGFSGEWEEKALDDEVDLFSGLTYSPNHVVKENGTFVLRSSNVKNGEIVQADNVYVNTEVVNSENVRVGDIIVVVRNGSRSLIGKHAAVKKEMNNTVIGAFMTGIHSKQPDFINALLDTNQFNKEIEKNLGATINQITNGALRKMKFYFSKTQEQTKIGNLFKQLDTLITQHQTQLKKLNNIKQACLEKMFI